jgi:transposase
MFAVEIYAAVRRFVFVEGKSRREAAKVFGLSRDRISKMCRYSATLGYVRSKPPERPKLGALVPAIDAILESDKTAPAKQKRTAKRIFERLRMEHGYVGGYTVVKDYVRLARARSREVFVSLAHPPGHAQVDFREAQLAAVKSLIIDELGYVPLSQTGAELLFEVFSQRHERGSIIVNSNLPVEGWTTIFGSQRLTGGLLDRLTHHVHILELNGESYSLKQSMARRKRGARPSDDTDVADAQTGEINLAN